MWNLIYCMLHIFTHSPLPMCLDFNRRWTAEATAYCCSWNCSLLFTVFFYNETVGLPGLLATVVFPSVWFVESVVMFFMVLGCCTSYPCINFFEIKFFCYCLLSVTTDGALVIIFDQSKCWSYVFIPRGAFFSFVHYSIWLTYV